MVSTQVKAARSQVGSGPEDCSSPSRSPHHPPHHLREVGHILVQVFVVERLHDRLLRRGHGDSPVPVWPEVQITTHSQAAGWEKRERALNPAVKFPAGDVVLPHITELKHFSLQLFLNFFFMSCHHHLTTSPCCYQTNC